MPAIKFFFASGACSLCPHILLHEVAAEFQPLQVINHGPEVRFSEDFHRINPKMRVPVIAVDEEVITELPAVATIIASLAPERHLMGKNPLDTARVYEWMNYLSGTLHAGGFGHLFRPERWTTATDGASLEGVKTKARERVVECFEFIEGRLQGIHAVGGYFTAVDPFLYVFYRWGTMIGEDMSAYPKYSAVVRNLETRPAVQTTIKKEKLSLIFE
ncbi:glutathione S-transferase GST-6.0 [Aspergillus steynii IBT 23096]|uniref:Glutathione S-transferase GST-6.0 n=1 Tax=Aspergillus steynii IBT 23096 TaxID=1392250 RepID=A0A2I2GEX9_9EURO|nr:glutathione S-transferase GST-6.0 [Aspergillus steynii IBT 23096]PLB51432.1 glutathione S-transferase GST-6.0 [Aspergillus steynii IBT 23096]